MRTRTRDRVVYDHRGEPVTYRDVAWGETGADIARYATRRGQEDAARARGEYVPSLAANAVAWSLSLDLADAGIHATAYPVKETPVEGRPAVWAVYRINGTYDAAAAEAAVTNVTLHRETKVVDPGVLWVRALVVDPFAADPAVAAADRPF